MPDYDSPAKAAYRQAFYHAVDVHCPIQRHRRRVLILEESQGHEARFLLSLGYRAQHIMAVNRQAGKMAHVNRILAAYGHAPIMAIGGEFTFYAAGQPFDVVNFDSCQTIHRKDWEADLNRLLAVRRKGDLVGINTTAYRDTFHADHDRITAMRNAARARRATVVEWGKYYNRCGKGGSPMLWFLLRKS